MSKQDLRLDWCSYQAAKYAVMNWHYSRTMPATITKPVNVGVWESGQFIGAVIFTAGASSSLGKPYGLGKFEVAELQRVALTSHKNAVSRILAIAVRMLKTQSPGLRLLVSFADQFQSHHGGIYQAAGWIYTGETDASVVYFDRDGIQRHPRNVGSFTGSDKYGVKKYDRAMLRKEVRPPKYRYLMPLDNAMREQIAPLAKPYPKRQDPRAGSVDSDTSAFHVEEGGANPTPALQDEQPRVNR